MAKAQSSIEYLLLLAALLFFFAVFAPLMHRAYALSLYSANVLSARRFSEEVGIKAGELGFLGDGSVLLVKARPVGVWIVSASENRLEVLVKSDVLAAEKAFEVSFPNELDFLPQTVNNKQTFALRKIAGKVLLENHDSDSVTLPP